MSSTSSIMSTALSGMMAYQAAISITSENIANVNTDGYSRQVVLIKARNLVSATGTEVMAGVQSTDARRVTDAFCFKQVLSSNQELGQWEASSKYLDNVEALFKDSSGSGLSESLSNFWSSWQDLVNNPSGYAERAAVISAAQTLAEEFNQDASGLKNIQKNIDREVSTSVVKINDITSQIAGLNAQLARTRSSGESSNSIQDSLANLTSQLSSLVNVTTYENDLGQVQIQLSDGKSLVNGSHAFSLGTATNATTGFSDVTWSDGAGTTRVVTSSITGGSLGGALSVRDDYIPGYLNDLNQLAGSIIDQVNNLLTSGYDQNGSAGLALFTGTDATDMAVSTTVADDPTLIAAAATADSAPGDSTVASEIAKLASKTLMNGGTSTYDEFYGSLVSQVGSDVQKADDKQSQQKSLSTFYQNYLSSVVGVSTDEESANLVQYQEAYQASAKVVTVLQEILKTLVEL